MLTVRTKQISGYSCWSELDVPRSIYYNKQFSYDAHILNEPIILPIVNNLSSPH